ncbi:MAG: hypothetical protein M8843_05410 [marine benthic group bacterium]|nr:hypothetical protein [Gemmatimonadota bacterium]
MRISRARLLAASVLSVAALACTENSNDALGPSEAELDPVTVPEPSFAYMAGDSCLDFAFSATPGDGSPCDAFNGRNGLPGFYFLPSLVGNPGASGELQSGLAADLVVQAVPFDCSGRGCETYSLRVREKGGVYTTSFKLNKKLSNLAESSWRILVSLDAGDGSEPTPLGFRDIKFTNSPSSDQPSNEPTLDIQFGSNQAIKFFIDRNVCANLESGTSVTCVIPDDGGSLGLITPEGQQIEANIGPGNGARVYTLTSTPGAVDVDLRKLGDDFTITADPPFAPDYRLNASDVRVCEPAEFDTSGNADAYIVQQDAQGQSVLTRFDVSCPLFTTSVGLLDGVGDRLGTLASLFAPQPLIATAAVKAGTGGGGTLRRLSSFVLAEVVEMDYDTPSDGTFEVATGESVDATVRVGVEDGAAAQGATVRFFANTGDGLTCDGGSGSAAAVDPSTGLLTCVELTGIDGLASVSWTPGEAGERKLYALGCGVAVPGAATPGTASNEILGVLQDANGGICDRDPLVGGDGYDPTIDGYANGVGQGLNPFEPTAAAEIAINDLPLVFTATVGGCDPVGEEAVSCSFTDTEGGTLIIDDGDQQVQLNIGPGNGDRQYTLAFNDNAVDVDLRKYGRSVSVTASPPFAPADRLNASEILFCRTTFDTSGENDAFVVQQDANGQSILPPVQVSCPIGGPPVVSVLDRLGGGLLAAASWFTPQPLAATAPFKAGTGGGGTLRRLSDFDLVETSAAFIESGDGLRVLSGTTIPASVRVRVNDGNSPETGTAAEGATIRFFAETDDGLTCGDGSAAAVDPSTGLLTCAELTGTDGLAAVSWTPGVVGERKLYALGCGIAVEGLDTPSTATGGVLGVLQSDNGGICDRDPFVGGDGYDATIDGYANGVGEGTDPFDPSGGAEIAINDLPLVFTATVADQVVPGTGGASSAFGARLKSFGNTGDREFYLGTDIGSGVRVDADISWVKPSTNAFELSYDPTGTGTLASSVVLPSETTKSLTYSDVAGTQSQCTSGVDVLLLQVANRDDGTTVQFNNVAVNGTMLGNFSAPSGESRFWTLNGFNPASGFTVTGDLFIDGTFDGGNELSKVEVTAACLP